jgi:hypothetical protein
VIVTCANKFWAPAGKPALASEPCTGQLNPKTYRVVHDVLRDLVAAFPDPYLHAGADEVSTACWEDDPVVRRFLKDGGTHDRLLELFVNGTRPFLVHELNRTAVYWEDVLLGPRVSVRHEVLPRETTVLYVEQRAGEHQAHRCGRVPRHRVLRGLLLPRLRARRVAGQRQPVRQAGEGARGLAVVQRPRWLGRVLVRAIQDVAAHL